MHSLPGSATRPSVCRKGLRTIMGVAFRVWVLAAVVTSGETLAQTPAVATKVHPGILGAFLQTTKNPSSLEESLSNLAGSGGARASFAALIVWDPAFPTARVKGLRVELSEVGWRDTVYLDDDYDEETGWDSLKRFEDEMARVAADRNKLLERNPNLSGSGTTALNRINPELFIPRTSVLNVDWYRDEEHFGVAMSTGWHLGPPADRTSPREGPRWECGDPDLTNASYVWHSWLYFPREDLAHVVEIVARGRAFLQAH
jgi:hypothetical protein